MGITVVGYVCRGTLALDGRAYEDVITGTSRIYHRGDTLPGVADPNQPSTLSTATAVDAAPPLWRMLVTPEVVSTMLLIVTGLCVNRRRRAR
jgi:hypothetical protein